MLPCVCLFSTGSQRMSKCSKNICDTLDYQTVCHFFVLTTFDVICDLLLTDAQQHGIYLLNIPPMQNCCITTVYFLSCYRKYLGQHN